MQGNENKGFWIDKNSSEFSQIQYYLKSSISSSKYNDISNIEIWKIENQDLFYHYEKKTSNMLKVISLQNINQIESTDNNLESICTNGIILNNQKGFSFEVGSINDNQIKKSGNYCLIYYEVAIGRAFVSDNTILDTKIELPSGYDSYYIPSYPLDRNSDGKFDLEEYQLAATFQHRSPNEYNHKYFITNASQICPKYIIRFDYEINKSKSSYTHSIVPNSTVTKSSTPTKKDPMNNISEDCIYFDSNTLNAVSQQTINSTISPNQKVKSSSTLVTIDQAFNQAMEEFHKKDQDTFTKNKKEWIDKHLNLIDEKVREVNLNYAEISEAISEAAAKALLQLQGMTRKKLETCLALEIELRRQTEHLLWLDTHIDEHALHVEQFEKKNGLSNTEKISRKLEFIKNWKFYNMYRNAANRAKPTELQVLSTIHGDNRIHADINIYSDPFFNYNSKLSVIDKGAFIKPTSPLGKLTNTLAVSHYNNTNVTNNLKSKSLFQYHALPIQPTESLVSASLQSIVDDEMLQIQHALVDAIESSGPSLPRSITKPFIPGNSNMNITLHELINDIVKEEDNVIRTGSVKSKSKRHNLPKHQEIFQQRLLHIPADNVESYNIDESMMSSIFDENINQTKTNSHSINNNNATNTNNSNTSNIPHNENKNIEVSSEVSSLRTNNTNYAPFNNEEIKKQNPSLLNHGMLRKSSIAITNTINLSSQEAKTNQYTNNSSNNHHQQQQIDMNLNISMSITQLQKLIHTKIQYSIHELSMRKIQHLQSNQAISIEELDINRFIKSDILQGDEGYDLFFILPFFSKPPKCKKIYSTSIHSRSLDDMYSKTVKHFGPSVIIIQSGDFIFGAYLSHQIMPGNTWGGNPSCFLFSISLDIKLPYHARGLLQNNNESLNNSNVISTTPLAFFAQPNTFFVGNGDLCLENDLLSGSTELENCYGCGLTPHSPEACCLLAGSPIFSIDILEVWSILI